MGRVAKPVAFYADICSTAAAMDRSAKILQVPETVSVDYSLQPQPSVVSEDNVNDDSATTSSSYCLSNEVVRRLQQLHGQYGGGYVSAAACHSRLRRIPPKEEWNRWADFFALPHVVESVSEAARRSVCNKPIPSLSLIHI